MADVERDKYSLLNELTFKTGLAHRYAITLEHRLIYGLDLEPYLDLLTTAMTEAESTRAQLAALLAEQKQEAA
jgi:hypothetical protein